MEPARLRLSGNYDNAAIERLTRAHGADIAVVYDSWLRRYGGAPASWTMVGEWQIRDNVICGSDTVAFYAVTAADAEPLARRLRAYSTQLPAAVIERGNYTGGR